MYKQNTGQYHHKKRVVPIATPRQLIYMKTGLLDIEDNVKKNRINYANSIAKHLVT